MAPAVTKTYHGLLALHSYGEAEDILFLSTLREPLSKILQSDMAKRRVTVHYWVTDMEATKEQAQEDFAKTLMGGTDCKFRAKYSDITGYLWTDEWCKVGGHDLIAELKSHAGKWLILEVEIHGEGKNDA